MEKCKVANHAIGLTQCASHAVGVPKISPETEDSRKWFIAIVPNNTERNMSKRLADMGIETFMPTQNYTSIWKDGRRKQRERILLPGKVLVHCTEAQRLQIVNLPFITRFMVNMAMSVDAYNRHPIAEIAGQQVEVLKFMLGQSEFEVNLNQMQIKPGMMVKVVRGSLSGLEGIVTETSSNHLRLFVELGLIGCANVLIDTQSVIEVKSN